MRELTELLWSEYETFATRDLSEIRPLYLFVDGLFGVVRATQASAWHKRRLLSIGYRAVPLAQLSRKRIPKRHPVA